MKKWMKTLENKKAKAFTLLEMLMTKIISFSIQSEFHFP